MGKEVRSIRYFDGLFMKAEEFIQEQNYHTRMRRLHNRYLHSSGIVWGLEIQKSKDSTAAVTITEGMALNKVKEDGEEISKEIILTDDTDVNLSSYGAVKTVYIYISYSREPAPKNSDDSKNIHWLEEGKPVVGTDRSKINEDENILLGKVSLINTNGTVTVDQINYEENGGSLRKYAGFSGKSLQTEEIILAIDGVTSGFASIEGKLTGVNKGIQVNSPITSFVGALSIGDKLGVGGNVQLPDNKSLVLGTTNPVSLHNNNAAPELWLEATGQASSALAIGTAFDIDKQVKLKYTPGTVGAAAGELRIGQDVRLAGTFTHGITTLYTNGAERLRIDAAGNVTVVTGSIKITNADTFLDFGIDSRQMLNLGAGYGIGVQAKTQYYRSTDYFAWYIGGTHSDAELTPGAGGTAAMIIKLGNVGIGTTTPSGHQLDIASSQGGANNSAIRAQFPGGGSLLATEFAALAHRGGAWTALYAKQGAASSAAYFDGNVGIGTNTPSDRLDVEGNIRVNDSNIWLRGGTDANHGIGWYGTGKLFATANIDGPAVFGCSGGALGTACGGQKIALYWNAAGNVGIGTTTPPQKLSVSGQESSANGMGAAIGISNTAPGGANWYLRVGATGTSTPASGFSIADDSAYRLVIDKSGNVGIGTNTPSDKLDVEGNIRVNDSNIWLRGGTDANHGIGWYGTGKLFATANIDGPAVFGCSGGALGTVCGGQKIALYWNATGNVGIGITNPQAKLDVAGSIRAGGSDIYFTETNHNHTGIGNTAGCAAIENATNYGALMILGRTVSTSPIRRVVKLYDYLEINGSQKITGRLGTSGYDPDSGYPTGWGGGIHTWDIAAHGTGKAVSGWQSGNWDLAEKFENYDESLEPGDVVVADMGSSERLIKSTDPYQDNLLGVISEKPGFLLGVNWEDPQYPTALALAGRVKVKVNMEGGPIREGDYLTSSSEESYAMKANRSGRVIGIALESFDGSQGSKGKVVVFVNPHWWGGYNRRNT